jgi:hypothetical protein
MMSGLIPTDATNERWFWEYKNDERYFFHIISEHYGTSLWIPNVPLDKNLAQADIALVMPEQYPSTKAYVFLMYHRCLFC